MLGLWCCKPQQHWRNTVTYVVVAWPAAVAHRLYLRRLQRKAKKKQRFINRCVVTSIARDYNIPIET